MAALMQTRFIVRRGLMVLLDLVNSTESLLACGGEGLEKLNSIISALAEVFWEADAEVTAFTGDGILAFFPDRDHASLTTWGLSNALRRAHSIVADAVMQGAERLRLRGGVHHGDVLQVLDGPFVGQLIGRTVLKVEEVAEAARQRDGLADHLASIAITQAGHQRCGLPVHPTRVLAPPGARLLSSGEDFLLLDLPPESEPVSKRLPPEQEVGREAPLAEEAEGLVFYLAWKPGSMKPTFPPIDSYVSAMWHLVDLVALCGFDVLNVMPTSVLGFSPWRRGCIRTIETVGGILLGAQAKCCIGQTRRQGWPGVCLRAGLVYGSILRMVTGPLAGQALGDRLAMATRFAYGVADNSASAAVRPSRRKTATPPSPDVSLAMPLAVTRNPAEADFWTHVEAHVIPNEPHKRQVLPLSAIRSRKAKNLTSVGYMSAQKWIAVWKDT